MTYVVCAPLFPKKGAEQASAFIFGRVRQDTIQAAGWVDKMVKYGNDEIEGKWLQFESNW